MKRLKLSYQGPFRNESNDVLSKHRAYGFKRLNRGQGLVNFSAFQGSSASNSWLSWPIPVFRAPSEQLEFKGLLENLGSSFSAVWFGFCNLLTWKSVVRGRGECVLKLPNLTESISQWKMPGRFSKGRVQQPNLRAVTRWKGPFTIAEPSWWKTEQERLLNSASGIFYIM